MEKKSKKMNEMKKERKEEICKRKKKKERKIVGLLAAAALKRSIKVLPLKWNLRPTSTSTASFIRWKTNFMATVSSSSVTLETDRI